jgi:formylglycine-generating enzyme required for sulfatase activity
MVLVFSPAAFASPLVQIEANAALLHTARGRLRGILPVLAAPCAPDGIPPTLAGLPRLDAVADYRGTLLRLLDTLDLTPPAAPPVSGPGASGTRAGHPGMDLVPVRVESGPPERVVLPPELTRLGLSGWRLGGSEVILPAARPVPASSFRMGGTVSTDETPPHTVMLGAYAIGAYPVTVAEYACFVRAGHPAPAGRDIDWIGQMSRLDRPIVNITWHDADFYAAWLARRTGQPWRVASEAEWEKAARWDSASGTSREYPWGDEFDSTRCNTRESSIGTTTRVDLYPAGASPAGALDMAGNVWEWTSSLLRPYPYDPAGGRERPDSAGPRVLRGGSCDDSADHARPAYRLGGAPDMVARNIGFRLALSAPERLLLS